MTWLARQVQGDRALLVVLALVQEKLRVCRSVVRNELPTTTTSTIVVFFFPYCFEPVVCVWKFVFAFSFHFGLFWCRHFVDPPVCLTR